MVIHSKINHTGKERGLPIPYANKPRLISRVGVYDGFSATNSRKICWGGNTNGSADTNHWVGDQNAVKWEGNNLIVHWIRCINNDNSAKEIHFWQNNYDADQSVTSDGDAQKGDVTHADYMFNISMAAGKGKTDTRIDFPLPLLIMGGGTIAVRNVKEEDNTDRSFFSFGSHDCIIQICYTILNSTPATAPYKKLKYKYLSAVSSCGAGDTVQTTAFGSGWSQDVKVVRPDAAPEDDTNSDPPTATHKPYWYEDMEIWGGTVMSTENPAGNSDGTTARARVKNASNEIVATLAVIKGPANALELPIIPVTPALSNGNTGWTHGFSWGTSEQWWNWANPLLSGSFPISVSKTSFKLYDAGSDTQVSMFRYPIYCMGVKDPDVSSFNVSVTGTQAEETKSTWFYRPARKKATDHGWI